YIFVGRGADAWHGLIHAQDAGPFAIPAASMKGKQTAAQVLNFRRAVEQGIVLQIDMHVLALENLEGSAKAPLPHEFEQKHCDERCDNACDEVIQKTEHEGLHICSCRLRRDEAVSVPS